MPSTPSSSRPKSISVRLWTSWMKTTGTAAARALSTISRIRAWRCAPPSMCGIPASCAITSAFWTSMTTSAT